MYNSQKRGTKTKKLILQIFVTALAIAPFAQEVQHDVVAINVEVPVRVFKGNTFIDNLTMEDFEVYEDGKLQKIEAVYLIKKTDIKREETGMEKEEARKKFSPEASRNFVLLFEIHEYFPNIGKAIEYFFTDVFQPGDTLRVVTPFKTYKFNNKALEMFTRKEIAVNLKKQLRKDIKMGTAVYRSLVRDLENIMAFNKSAQEGKDDMRGMVRMMYANILTRLRNLRYIDEKRLLDFAGFLKEMEGQKHVFFFHQKLIVPLIKFSQDTQIEDFGGLEDFEAYLSFDVEKAKMVFSDTSISAHFIFFTKTSGLDASSTAGISVTSSHLLDTRPTDTGTYVEMQDLSGNLFDAFKEIVQATGGTVDSSANAASSFKKAVYASENYYLLYYAPKDYKADGKFRKIDVRVKNKKYRITHRAGYIAD
jgi:VWFA-related protein